MNTSNKEPREPQASIPQDPSDREQTHEIELNSDQVHELVDAHFGGMELGPDAGVYVGRRSAGKESFSSDGPQKNGRYSLFTPAKGSPDRPLLVQATVENPIPTDVVHPTVGASLTLIRHANNSKVRARGTQKQTLEYRERRTRLVEEIIGLASVDSIGDEEERFTQLVDDMGSFIGSDTSEEQLGAAVFQTISATRSLIESAQSPREAV